MFQFLTPKFLAPTPIDQHGNTYTRQVDPEKVDRILKYYNGRVILLVNRLTSEAFPVILHNQHYYVRTRDRNHRFIWMRYRTPQGMNLDQHREVFTAYFFELDYARILEENVANYAGERVSTLPPLTLKLDP